MKLTTNLQRLTAGKNVLILGFGREGKSTLRELAACGEYRELWIADRNSAQKPDGVTGYYSGENYQKHLDEFDVVFKSPGVVLEREFADYRCHIVSQMEVFLETYKAQIVGITGTKGKSTTTTLLYHILKTAGRDVLIAGNIGIPVFDIAKDMREDTAVMCEMSSHQLEFMRVSPHIGVYLNIHEEHLDHYGTMEKYTAAKENIYRNMELSDKLFCNVTTAPKEGDCKASVITVSGEENADIAVFEEIITCGHHRYRIPMEHTALLGKHSQFNIAVAYGICKEFGITDEVFEKGLVTYQALPHRLEYFGTFGGVKYYDDSISTICDSVIQALESIKDVSTLILGGMDRGIDYRELIEALSNAGVEHIILMEATGKRIFAEIMAEYPNFSGKERLCLVEHMDDAVIKAAELTSKGMSCVLSPAAASYGIFKNFEERGDYFKEAVKRLN